MSEPVEAAGLTVRLKAADESREVKQGGERQQQQQQGRVARVRSRAGGWVEWGGVGVGWVGDSTRASVGGSGACLAGLLLLSRRWLCPGEAHRKTVAVL